MKKITLTTIFLVLIAGVALAGSKCVTNGGYPAALSEKLLDEAITYSTQGDIAALQKLLDTNYVFIIKDGITVYRQDQTWGGKVKIRLPGQRQTVWTVWEAVDCE